MVFELDGQGNVFSNWMVKKTHWTVSKTSPQTGRFILVGTEL